MDSIRNGENGPLTEYQAVLVAAIRGADRPGARELIENWAGVNGYDHLLENLLEPAMAWIGKEWLSAKSVTLAQAYVAARVAEDTLIEIASRRAMSEPASATRGPVVIGNIEDDFHSLGRRMVGTFLRVEGWIVHDLGNDVPPTEFVNKAIEVGARVIGASAMIYSTAHNIHRLRRILDERGLAGRIQLAVGGAVFLTSPGLAEEVGGDGTSVNALGASQLFNQLWEYLVRAEAAA